MTNISNLHSLLGGKWMITDEAANSLYPFLLNILTKGELPEKSASTSSIIYMNLSQEIFDEDDYNEIEEEEREQVVAILPIKGPILKYSQWCGPTGTKSLQSRLERLKADENVIAVLLDIDSGGGQVAGTAEFAEYIYNYPKRIESYTDGGIASAAFHIASATKKISVNPNADYIGSVGTMFKTVILDGYFEKMGAKVIEEYATKSTKKNESYRELKKGNNKILIKEELDPINEHFHSKVKLYRPNMDDSIYNGHHTVVMQEALSKGMIDVLAGKKEVIASLFETAKKEQNDNNENSNNQNHLEMADQEISFDQISATLNIEGGLKLSSKILSGKKGAFLTAEQLALIESKMASHSSSLQKVQDEVDQANQTNTALNDAVTESLTTAGLAAKETPEASIKMLGQKVKEYGSQPGEKPSTPQTEGDRNTAEEEGSTAIMDSIIK